jgi:predicted nucleic acid-binding protein
MVHYSTPTYSQTLSEFNRRGEPDPYVRQWLAATPLESLYVSVITFAEIQLGIELLPTSKRRADLERWMEQDFNSWFQGRVLLVDPPIVKRWAVLTAERQRTGRPLANFDGLLAATALHHGLTLVTRNVKDFAELGVSILNPWHAKPL